MMQVGEVGRNVQSHSVAVSVAARERVLCMLRCGNVYDVWVVVFLKTEGEFLIYHRAAQLQETTCSSILNNLSALKCKMDVKILIQVLKT